MGLKNFRHLWQSSIFIFVFHHFPLGGRGEGAFSGTNQPLHRIIHQSLRGIITTQSIPPPSLAGRRSVGGRRAPSNCPGGTGGADCWCRGWPAAAPPEGASVGGRGREGLLRPAGRTITHVPASGITKRSARYLVVPSIGAISVPTWPLYPKTVPTWP